jgi:predicted DNA-binding transcriptional regulator AlpA
LTNDNPQRTLTPNVNRLSNLIDDSSNLGGIMRDRAASPDLVTIPEFATMSRRSIDTIRYWRKRGYGPRGFRIGRQVVYDRQDIEAFIETCRTTAGTS